MLNPNDAKACYLFNTTDENILGIPTRTYKLLLGNYYIGSSMDAYYIGMYLSDGRLRLCDFKKDQLEINSSCTLWGSFRLECSKYKDYFLYPHSDAGDLMTKIHWNQSAKFIIYDIVGADLLSTDWTGLIATKYSVLEKFNSIRPLLEAGMFSEASSSLDQLDTDDFLTLTKIAEYKSYIDSCDIFIEP